ncbi:hypothetical protein [Bacillus anthracis]|uniref:hypothetical protein n=1 Tax=Bacillus cereus group TaxID=86661 RepID=UPI0001A1DE56|nr:Gluconate kinase [Bacillus thuringiensis serovar andalousiensis BGSC 4AW1]OUA97959.1 hypothetical protein BK714_16020 [Bacillus thuringiensis serovar oswaldocruzi]TEA48557.1 hypothetical protein EZE46_19025 [Bacillus sp. BH2]
MKSELAPKMGIHKDTPVVIGASDGVLANVGVGAITIGTSPKDPGIIDSIKLGLGNTLGFLAIVLA